MTSLWGEFDQRQSGEHCVLSSSDFLLSNYEWKNETDFAVPPAIDFKQETNLER